MMQFHPVFSFTGNWNLGAFGSILTAEILGIVLYLLQSGGLYQLSRSRQLRNPWFSWVPGLREFQLGSLADQYQYVVNREVRWKRWVLLILGLLKTLLTLLIGAFAGAALFGFFFHGSEPTGRAFWQTTWALRLLLPIACLTLWRYIVRILSLYDVYRSCDPGSAGTYTILSVLFPVLIPIFLFCNRNSERGMPPRRENINP